VNNVVQILGLADKIKAIFPPFPLPGFVPDFTGYDLDQQNIDWYELYNMLSPDEEPIHVRTYIHYLFSIPDVVSMQQSFEHSNVSDVCGTSKFSEDIGTIRAKSVFCGISAALY